MINFLNPFLIGGLAAISAPIIIHLLHRRKVKVVDWAAMRFLLEMLAKSRRRLLLEDILLLLVRSLAVACIALAMIRPAFLSSADSAAGENFTRQGRTASVLLIDDSVSATAGRAQPAFENMKKLADAYVESLAPGDEISVLTMSQLGAAASDPVFDLAALKGQLAGMAPGYVASDIPALIEAGLTQLKRHVNPGAEIVLLTDGRKDGWKDEERSRWDDLRERLRGGKSAVMGSRQRPRLIVLAPQAPVVQDNIGVVAVSPDRTLVSAGSPAGIRVSVANFGTQAGREVAVQLLIDGQSLETKRIAVPPAGRQAVLFTHTFPKPASYGVEAVLVDHHDSLEADNRRATSIQAEPSLPVLLVEDSANEGSDAPGLDSKLGFLQYALQPGTETNAPFQVTRIPITRFLPSMLSQYRVVVLGDLRLMEQATVDALERFIIGGGGVLVGLGPATDPVFVNKYWARGGDGFLPCPLERPYMPPKPVVPAAVNLAHTVFSGFSARTDDAWRAAAVRAYYKLDPKTVKPAELDMLLKLDNGDPLIVERRRGLGLITLFATSLNADWADLPLQAAYVPLVRGIVGHLGNFIIPPRNLNVGEPLIFARLSEPAQQMQAEGPDGQPVKLAVGAWEGRDAVLSGALIRPGVYTLRNPRDAATYRYAVSISPVESSLIPIADRDVSQAFDRAVALFRTPDQIAANLDPSRRTSVEIWKWLLGAAILLLFLEAWMTRRQAGSADQESFSGPSRSSRTSASAQPALVRS